MMQYKKVNITCHPSMKKTMEKAFKGSGYKVKIKTNTKLAPEIWYVFPEFNSLRAESEEK